VKAREKANQTISLAC